MTRFVLKSLALLVLSLVIGAAAAPLLPKAILAAASPALGPVLLSSALTIVFALCLAGRSSGGVASRALLLLWLIFGLQANNLVETLIFDIGLPRPELWRFYLHGFVSTAVLALAIAWAAGPPLPAASRAPRPLSATLGRLAVVAVVYIGVYFTAGEAIYPYIASFYGAFRLPAVTTIVPLALTRGLVFGLLALALVERLGPGQRRGPLWVAGLFSVVGGVAPLLMPNPFMPDYVRYAHMVEVGISNVFFGLFAGALLARDERMPG